MKLRIPMLAAAACLLLDIGAARADDHLRFPLSEVYRSECGSCHLPYPPGLLPASSWKAIMAGLGSHFGSDASLAAAESRAIGDFLAAHAGRPERTASAAAPGRPNLRITETAWFRHEHRDGHDGLGAALWTSPAVGRPGNCGACHRAAAEGDYSERGIRIPRSN